MAGAKFNTIVEVAYWEKTPPMVEVTWFDAAHTTGYVWGGTFDCGITNRTTGYLIYEGKDWTMVAMEWSDENRKARDVTQIPTGWIKKVRRLK
jgi:hypothetical protein